MTGPLEGRVALVTGASSGLGRRFALALHGAGAQVVVGARREAPLRALADELGEGVLPVACDVTVEHDARRLVDEALARFGRIDVLVNNAGVSRTAAAEDEPLDQFRFVLEVNLVAVFHLCQLVGRHMLERGTGSIVNVSSMLGLVASSPINQASYCASKAAVLNLTRELAAQWGGRGVRVNALAPGWFPSEMTADMWGDDRSLAFVRRNTPLGRGGTEQELDGALLLLASEAGSFITGQTLVVDGGWTTR